jgi:two-component system response regulator FlrC
MLSSNVQLVGKHPKFTKALDFARNVASTRSAALVSGESGTGKKALCQYIHGLSSRAQSDLLVVNCAEEAQTVENNILGYRNEEGKFTRGVLESANGGAVILTNIDALDEKFQKRLYQIIQELPDYELDVRLYATTSKNLSKYVGAGRFYRALYTMFSNAQINLSPLRERSEDIEVLARHFIQSYSIENDTPIEITDDAMAKINSFYWTHNVSELKSVIDNASESSSGVLDIKAIEQGERQSDAVISDYSEDGIKLMSLKDAEKLLIRKALIHTSENRTQAAKILGVSIRTLRNKINEYRGDGTSYFVNLR